MRLFKKAAALFFCLALALSVMAVTALAEGEPQFKVLFKPVTAVDTTGQNGAEWDKDSTATYEVYLASDTAVTVNALEFAVKVNEGTSSRKLTLSSVSAYHADEGYYADPKTSEQEFKTTPLTSSENDSSSNPIYKISLDSLGVAEAHYYSLTAETLTDTTVTGTKVAVIAFSTTGLQNSDVLTFELTGINVHETSRGEAYSASADAVSVEIDPLYTITVMDPTKDSNYNSNKVLDTDSTTHKTYAYNVTSPDTHYNVSKGTYQYTLLHGFTTGTSAITSTNYHGYKFYKYVVSSTAGGNWGAGSLLDDAYTFGDSAARDHYGDVTLYAMYDAIQYTVTFADSIPEGSAVTLPSGATAGSTNGAGSQTYYITDVAAAGYFGVPSRDGYTFKGWKASSATAHTDEHDASDNTSTTKVAWTDNTIYYATITSTTAGDPAVTTTTYTPDTIGLYGNVTLTAQWELDGEFVQVAYAYTDNSHVLTLFAIEDTAKKTGTYTVKNGDKYSTMFILESKYAKMFGKTAGETPTDKVASTGWTIYGYLTPVETQDKTMIRFNQSDSSSNTGLTDTAEAANDYDVTGNSGVVNSGDYGSVGYLLTHGDSYSSEIGVQGRLKANAGTLDSKDDNNYSASYQLGTIRDINSIMLKAAQ